MAKPTWPWEYAASVGEAMPSGLELADQMAFQAMRGIYAQYRSGSLGRNQCAKEKADIKKQYDLAVEKYRLYTESIDRRIKIVKATESANNRCRLDPTPENALALCNAIDGIGV